MNAIEICLERVSQQPRSVETLLSLKKEMMELDSELPEDLKFYSLVEGRFLQTM